MKIPVAKNHVKEFEKMGFGMFVHWGLYSQLGKGEWIYCLDDSVKDGYEQLTDTFTAEDFDAEEFVKFAKNSGCKYITLTTRHHDGFSLYDTCGLSEYDAPHSAAKRDLIREFVDACNKYGIAPFFYHTTLDWHNPDYNSDFDKYLEYLRKSVEILCTNYGKIGGLWFDGNWNKPDADWKLDELYATIRKHQPEAMIINNTGLGERGKLVHSEIDSVTFEQGKPTPMDRRGMEKYVAAEMCYTINQHWGVGHSDFNYKSPKELIETLCDCRKVGANLLLNVGPEAQGKISGMAKELMNIIGKWMNIFGEAIYEGKPCSSGCAGKNFILEGENCLYIFAYDLGTKGNENVTVNGEYAGVYVFSDIDKDIEKIEWMDNNESLEFSCENGALKVNLTGTPYGVNYCVRVAKVYVK